MQFYHRCWQDEHFGELSAFEPSMTHERLCYRHLIQLAHKNNTWVTHSRIASKWLLLCSPLANPWNWDQINGWADASWRRRRLHKMMLVFANFTSAIKILRNLGEPFVQISFLGRQLDTTRFMYITSPLSVRTPQTLVREWHTQSVLNIRISRKTMYVYCPRFNICQSLVLT